MNESSNKIMYHIKKQNWGLVNTQLDYWSNSEWIIYYNGEIKYIAHYNISGDIEKKGTISNVDLEILAKIGNDNKNNPPEQDTNGADGTVYSIIYYDENGIKYELAKPTYRSKYDNVIEIIQKYYEVEYR